MPGSTTSPLEAIDLSFPTQATLYASHGLHPFAAKCPPQLARWAVERFSKPGDTVLDPMAGSGTVLVESRMLGRSAVGIEIDPLARLLAKVPDHRYQTAAELIEDLDWLGIVGKKLSFLPA